MPMKAHKGGGPAIRFNLGVLGFLSCSRLPQNIDISSPLLISFQRFPLTPKNAEVFSMLSQNTSILQPGETEDAPQESEP